MWCALETKDSEKGGGGRGEGGCRTIDLLYTASPLLL